jgi:hypothetical protein
LDPKTPRVLGKPQAPVGRRELANRPPEPRLGRPGRLVNGRLVLGSRWRSLSRPVPRGRLVE